MSTIGTTNKGLIIGNLALLKGNSNLTSLSGITLDDNTFTISKQLSSASNSSFISLTRGEENDSVPVLKIHKETTRGNQSIIFEEDDKIVISDNISSKGLQYLGDYSDNQILDNNAIPSVSAVKKLIEASESGDITIDLGSGLYKGTDGKINLGLNVSTLGTTNKGALTEDLYLLKGAIDAESTLFNITTKKAYIGYNNVGEIDSPRAIIDVGIQEGNAQPTVSIIRNLQSIEFLGSNIEVKDNETNKGFSYKDDYYLNGSQDERWIPDWGAVKKLLESSIENDQTLQEVLDKGSEAELNKYIYIGTGDYDTSGSAGIALQPGIDEAQPFSYLELMVNHPDGNQTISMSQESGIGVQDERTKTGLVYHDDYSVIGETLERWIPDWGAVKKYVNENSGNDATLQSITTESGDNITDNAIQITGKNNLDITKNGLVLFSDDTYSGAALVKNGAIVSQLAMAENGTSIISNSSTFSIQTDLPGGPLATFSTRVKGEDAENANEFVTKSQLDAKTSNLQATTTGENNNITDNILYITGSNNVKEGENGLALLFNSATGVSMLTNIVGDKVTIVNIHHDEDRGYGVVGSESVAFIGKEAAYPNEFITKSQFDLAIGEPSGVLLKNSTLADSRLVNVTGSDNIWLGEKNINPNGSNSTIIGKLAGDSSTSASSVVYIGNEAGRSAKLSSNSVFIGQEAGYNVSSCGSSVYIGDKAGSSSRVMADAIVIGHNAGILSDTSNYSIMIGDNAGNSSKNSSKSILIGKSAGRRVNPAIGHGTDCIIIGNDITLPDSSIATMNLGGVLFGTGIYSAISGNPLSTPVVGGKIGVGVIPTTSTLEVAGDIEVTTIGKGIIEKSPDGSRWRLTPSDTGEPIFTKIS